MTLRVAGNDALDNLDGLSGLASVFWSLQIIDNDALTSLDGLSSLTAVGLGYETTNNLALPDCESCDLLDQLTTEPPSIDVHDNLDDACTPVPDNCP
jgi:hypothetical protein